MNTQQSIAIDSEKIEKLIETRRENYLNDPLQIVADYNNEHKNIDEYNGRQLLEMIQNANDESDTYKAKKVLIHLDQDKLIIANNGNPFSEGGVESLMYSDLSPKTMEENKVGKKGLGFRSILNWSKEIYIASYDLHLKFSQSRAEDFLEKLIKENTEITEVLKRKTKVEKPISVLRCPYIEKSPSKKEAIYDTVIELRLKKNVQEEIINQISVDIVPEIMIFLNKLEEIEVKTATQHFAFYKVSGSNDSTITIKKKDFLNPQNSDSWLWHILEDHGDLKGIDETKKYELKIAYNPNEKIEHNKLFSFFRTEVVFPYPVIAHGSFELKSDRNQLSRDENKFNQQLLGKLAKLMIKCALNWTKKSDCNYEALKLVLPNPDHITVLNEDPWNFKELMEAEIQTAKIFPTIKNEYVQLTDEIKFYSTKIDYLIPESGRSLFSNLLKSSTESRVMRYFQSDKLYRKYEDIEFTEKINKLIVNGYLTDKQRVEWIYVLCINLTFIYASSKPTLPELLLNTEGLSITFGDEAISPSEGDHYPMPKHVKISSINLEQFKALKQQYDGINTRRLVENLKHYKVTEYAINVVMQKIVSSTHQQLEQSLHNKKVLVKEMHEALYGIYVNIKPDAEGKRTFPSNLVAPFLFTRNGNLKNADSLYFGAEYSSGKLNEGLFKGLGEDVFLGDRTYNQFDIDSEKSSAETYFKWLGVAEMPRKQNKMVDAYQYVNEPYFRLIIDNLNFPYFLISLAETMPNKKSFESCWSFEGKVLWYEHLEYIIEEAPIEFLLAWVIKDPEFSTSLVNNLEGNDTEIKFSQPKKSLKRKFNKKDQKSYIHHYLQGKEFIPSENGEKVKIKESLLASANLKPLIKPPRINYGASIFTEHNIDRGQIDYLLKRLGVKDSLKEMSINTIYDYLLIHHDSYENEPANIQNFYVSIIEATRRRNISEKEPSRLAYFQRGQIYANCNGENKFVPIQSVTYVDNPNFSQDLLAKLNCAKLPMRSGNKRILELFGVRPLDYIQFHVANNLLSDDHLNGQFSDELNKIKPYLFAYRFRKGLGESQIDKELNDLKKLKIKTCYDITVNYTLNDVEEQLKLNDYEFIQDHESQVFYVKINQTYSQYASLKSDFRFKETIADIICGAIKVTENRKDFMLLLGEIPSDWDKVLSREFDNYIELEKEIHQKFGETLSKEQKFWNTAFLASSVDHTLADLENSDTVYNKLIPTIDRDEWYKFYRAFNFLDLSNFDNIPFLQLIFKILEIDLIHFNEQGGNVINATKYWKNKIHVHHSLFEKKYASYLYRQNDLNGYIKMKNNGNYQPEIGITNSLFFDFEAKYIEVIITSLRSVDYNEVMNSNIVDLNELFSSNLGVLKEKLEMFDQYDYSVFESQKWEPNFNERVIFNDLDSLYEEISKKFKVDISDNQGGPSNGAGQITAAVKNNDELMKAIEEDIANSNYKLDSHNMVTVPPSLPNKNGYSGQSTFSKPKQITNADIGFIGEKYAFELLKEEYEEVEWVSEYALKAGFPKGRDGLGYDFECKKGEEVRFVEVKSTTTSNYAFHISSKEIQVGHDKHDVFDVLLITNLLKENKEFKYLKGIFKYSENESFLENSKFRVENDSYKIKFK